MLIDDDDDYDDDDNADDDDDDDNDSDDAYKDDDDDKDFLLRSQISITMTLIVGMTPWVLQITYISLLMTLLGPLIIPIVFGVMAKAYRTGYKRAINTLLCCTKNGRWWSRKIHVNGQ